MKRDTFFDWLPASRGDVRKAKEQIMARLDDLEALVTKIDDQLEKAAAEIVKTINDLKTQLGNVEIPSGAQAALDRLSTLAQGLDDIVPDQS